MSIDSGSYKTVQGLAEAEIVEKKSRFISHIKHVESEDEARDFIDLIRAEHQQARHNVYAYLLRGGRTRYSDDGEPAQTSGLPTFETLSHAELVDVAVVTTRYFGGILLGTGGLVRAYTQACKAAIEVAHIVEVCRCVDISFELPYDLNSAVQKLITTENLCLIFCEYTNVINMTIRVKEEQLDSIQKELVESTRGQVQFNISEVHEAIL